MNYYIGADLGTSALKLLLADQNGNTVKTVTRFYDVCYPKAGWSEQQPQDWWDAFCDGIKELAAVVLPEEIKGMAVAGQMHGLVILDKNDKVIRPAILWNDGRSSYETAFLNEVIGKEKLSELTANIAYAGFTAPKILWLKKHEPENYGKISKIMLPKDYINYRLTGIHATDFSDASGLLLLDVKNKCWSAQMLDICGIKEEQMPKLFESYQNIGNILPNIAKNLGLSESVTVAAGAGDNAGAAIGTATVGEGKCNISLGTSGTIFISSENFAVDKHNSLHSFCHADGKFHLMGCMLSAASCNKWFCDEILQLRNYSAVQTEITDDMLGNNEVFFLPYLMGERSPINDTDATGTFIGLRPNTKRSHMLLAVLEGVAFAIRDNLEVAKKLGIVIESSTVCGGGAKSHLWMKILANILDIHLDLPEIEEGPGYGAAKLAMIAAGAYSDIHSCVDVKIKKRISPQEDLVLAYEKKYQKFSKIYPNLKNLFKEIKE
ncbi:MAG: xylulokinase [Ruminococcaceae bacterium]|nr:xylulokinase [Oscillospiraceae bacterium]